MAGSTLNAASPGSPDGGPGWIVHKFGGTSLGTADRIAHVADLVKKELAGGRSLAVVVSAMSGVTDRLLKLASLAEQRDPALEEHLGKLRVDHLAVIDRLLPGEAGKDVRAAIEADLGDLREILRGVGLLRECSERARDYVAGVGEVWSSMIMAGVLRGAGLPVDRIDARRLLVVEHAQPTVNVVWEVSRANLDRFRAALPPLPPGTPRVVVCTGFVAQTPAGVATILGRNGSDYSAAIFGHLLDAEQVVIWTDVDGVMSADPNKVPEAVLVPELTYREAIELAYFGAKVLHPGTMGPAIAKSVPILIRNTFRPEAPGSVVKYRTALDAERPVKGFATIEPISLVNMEGTGMMGVPGIAGRLFDALHAHGISVIMISQASSEHSICFAVPAAQGQAAKAAAEEAFAAEMLHGKVQRVEVTGPCAILAAVGEGMAGTTGVSARFFGALGAAGVNIRAIAQGSSERNISVVIDAADAVRGLRAAHAGFYLSRQAISLGIVGTGNVGGALLDQIGREVGRLREELSIDLRVRGILTRKKMLLDERGLDPARWRDSLAASTRPPDLEAFLAHVRTDSIPHAAVIDCTPSTDLAARYPDLFTRGFHVITPNKRAGSAPLADYRRIRETARRCRRHFLYETTVCAGLPVIGTLHDLVQTGDTLIRAEGMFSGTLSFLFSRLSAGAGFAEALREAMAKGFTEPDPRDDLSGTDVARKVVILAREAGLPLELAEVPVLNLVPEELRALPLPDFLAALDRLEDHLAGLLAPCREGGREPRYLGRVDPREGTRVELVGVPRDSLFALATGGDNVVSFRTRRYDAHPLVVMGPGAGPEVTAAGVFADLLRLCSIIGGGQ
ncbi:MAG: bifunctional aspartate kinase/homoserine dehydrogenase I [Candidatus Riflebacteria bacterium]|nr:bifunctional aspartate kinase/homoserine dehydrogenase I [Candidatus Riflebacteria bacterium]